MTTRPSQTTTARGALALINGLLSPTRGGAAPLLDTLDAALRRIVENPLNGLSRVRRVAVVDSTSDITINETSLAWGPLATSPARAAETLCAGSKP